MSYARIDDDVLALEFQMERLHGLGRHCDGRGQQRAVLADVDDARGFSEFERRPQRADDLQTDARAAITECH
jgi:hypothetical protein